MLVAAAGHDNMYILVQLFTSLTQKYWSNAKNNSEVQNITSLWSNES